MTISTTETIKSYPGNGVTTAYPTNFEFQQNSTVTVYYQTTAGAVTTLIEATNYTLAGAGDVGGGTVTLINPATDAPVGGTLNISRFVPQVQSTDLQNGAIDLNAIEAMVDGVTMITQQLEAKIDSSSGVAIDAMKRDPVDPTQWAAQGVVINNLADGVAGSDSVNKSQLDAGIASVGGSTALESVDGVSNPGDDVDFVAGSGILIVPNNTAKTITFSVSGGAGSDVDAEKIQGVTVTTDAVANNTVMISNGTTWEHGLTTAALWNANMLYGRSIPSSAPTTGQILEWDGANWIYGSKAGSAIAGIASVEGVSNTAGNIDLKSTDSTVTITGDDGANDINFVVPHVAVVTGNPHSVTATEVGCPVSIDGVSNAGGDINLIAASGITITPDNGADTITFTPDVSTALWNANKLQGRTVNATTPSDGEVLTWQAAGSQWLAQATSAGSSISIGSYVGNGTTTNAVTGLGFEPDMLMIYRGDSHGFSIGTRAEGSGSPVVGSIHDSYGANAVSGVYLSALQWDADGFTLKQNINDSNASGITYYYLAIGV